WRASCESSAAMGLGAGIEFILGRLAAMAYGIGGFVHCFGWGRSRTVRKGENHSPIAVRAKIAAARTKANSAPVAAARNPARGETMTMTARLIERIVVFVRAWKPSEVIDCR